jgi:predicted transposase/invertase (TIGR01784 family)
MHDASYKLLFSHPQLVEDLLRGFVREPWVAELDFTTLETVPASTVSDDLRSRHNDLIWRVRWGPCWLYVYVMLEFQSRVDPYMAVRVMTYVGLLYQDLLRRRELSEHERLPPVLPIVLYNGEARWQAATQLQDLIEPLPSLERYRPEICYLLLDEGVYSEDQLHPMRNLAAALFRLEHSRDPARVVEVLTALSEWLQAPTQASLRRAFTEWLRQVLLPARLPGIQLPLLQELHEVRSMLAERVKEWTEQWKQEGLQEGLQQGEARGLARERALLRRQALRQFDAATAEELAVLLQAINDPDRLEDIGEWIVACSSAQDLLQRVRGSAGSD